MISADELKSTRQMAEDETMWMKSDDGEGPRAFTPPGQESEFSQNLPSYAHRDLASEDEDASPSPATNGGPATTRDGYIEQLQDQLAAAEQTIKDQRRELIILKEALGKVKAGY